MGFLVAAWLRLAGLGFLLDIAAVQVLEFLGFLGVTKLFFRFRLDFVLISAGSGLAWAGFWPIVRVIALISLGKS